MATAIKITLLSGLCPAGGEGPGGVVDTDVSYDRYGLPCIPAKRLKGCLREAALQIAGVMGEDFPREAYDKLFGRPGETGLGRLVLENAYLKDYEQISYHLQQLQAAPRYKEFFQPEYIKQYFTVIRVQNAVAHVSRTAGGNSPRVFRVVRKNTVFWARLLNQELEPAGRELLELACKALRRIGSGKTRGLGEVKCELVEVDPAAGRFPVPKLQPIPAVPGEVFFLPYRVELRSQLIVENRAGSSKAGNTYIPGGVILGGLANLYIKKKGLTSQTAHQDRLFRRLFLSPEVKFLPAYITTPDNRKRRCLPVPLSLVRDKDTGWVYNLAEPEQRERVERENMETEPVGRYGFFADAGMYLCSARSEIEYHCRQTRDSSKNGERVHIFHYRPLDKGQICKGFITGPGVLLQELVRLTGSRVCLGLGRSKTAQYGQVQFWPEPDNIRPAAAGERPGKRKKDCLKPGEQVVVTLTSPMILTERQTGLIVPDPKILARELNEQLARAGQAAGELELCYCCLRRELTGGFNGAWRLPRPQMPALAAGSVLVFNYRGKEKIPGPVLEVPGYGLRQNEGFGRILVNLPVKEIKYFPPSIGEDSDFDAGEIPPLLTAIWLTSIKKRLREELAADPGPVGLGIKQELAGEKYTACFISRLEYLVRYMESKQSLIRALETVKTEKISAVIRCLRNLDIVRHVLKHTLTWQKVHADLPSAWGALLKQQVQENREQWLKHYLEDLLQQVERQRRRLKEVKR